MLYLQIGVARTGGNTTRPATIGYFYKTEHPSTGRKSVFSIWAFFLTTVVGSGASEQLCPPSSFIPPPSPFFSLSCILLW